MPLRVRVHHGHLTFFMAWKGRIVDHSKMMLRSLPLKPMIGPALLTGAAVLNVVGGLILRREEPSRERDRDH